MVIVIKVIKRLSSILAYILILSCSASMFNENNKKEMIISFGSIYENEKLTLTINDKVYYADKHIKTNSLGTDPKSYIVIEAEKVHLKGFFSAEIDPELDKDFNRKLEIDTVLYRKKGRRVIVGANYNEYYVSQQNKKFKVE